MDDLRVDVKILHKNGSILELKNNVMIIDKRKMAVKFVGPEDVEKIYEFWRMEEGPLEATTNYDGNKQMSIRIDEGAAEEIILKLIFKPPHNLMAGYVATLLNSLLELEKCSQNQRKKFQETQIIVDVIIIQKIGEPLILKSRQLLIEPNSKSLQLGEKTFGVEKMRGKVKSPQVFTNSNRVLTIELKNCGSDLQINLIFLPPCEMMADLVKSLLNEMIGKGAEPVEIQDEPRASDSSKRASASVRASSPSEIGDEIIADYSIVLKNGAQINKQNCRLTFDRRKNMIRFETPSYQICEYFITQFMNRPLKRIKDNWKHVTITLNFDPAHKLNQPPNDVRNRKIQLKIHIIPPYSQNSQHVRDQINSMFEACKSEMSKMRKSAPIVPSPVCKKTKVDLNDRSSETPPTPSTNNGSFEMLDPNDF